MNKEQVIKLTDIKKFYQMGAETVAALVGVTVEINKGEFVAIIGPSGSGKSTLMNILGCLDNPSSGSYLLEGQEVGDLSEDELALTRNKKIGFVFQHFNLLARMSALENVALPLIYGDVPEKEIIPRATKALQAVGLGERLKHMPSEMSGGQMQRTAIARALVNEPSIIMADEPTGNLDTKTSIEVMHIFQQLYEEGKTIILVTHEPDIAKYTKRVIAVRDGLIETDTVQE